MTLDREQFKRDCADALEALPKDQRIAGLTRLADSIRTLSPTHQSHGEQIQAAAWATEENTVT